MLTETIYDINDDLKSKLILGNTIFIETMDNMYYLNKKIHNELLSLIDIHKYGISIKSFESFDMILTDEEMFLSMINSKYCVPINIHTL